MLRRAFVLLGFVSLATFAAAPAFAENVPQTFRDLLRGAADVDIPLDWDGVWSSTDSMYDCNGAFISVSTGLDTLCGGKSVTSTNSGGGVPLTCSGSSSSTSIDATCTGSQNAIPGCDANLSFHILATRSGEHYDGQFTTTIDYVGAACAPFFTDSCHRTSSHADRIGPAPPSYCATPTERTTWGRVKTIYR